MPGGGTILGIGYFAAVKLAGYSAAGVFINRREKVQHPHPVLFGSARTVLGVAAGMSYAFTLGSFSVSNQEIVFYAGLIPLRIVEWLLLLWLFYRNTPGTRRRWVWYIALGVIWSYVLDLPAVFAAFTLPGGFWIC